MSPTSGCFTPRRLLPSGALCLLLLLAGCATERPAPVRWRSTALGLCEDYPEETRTLANARRDLAAAKAAGAEVLRISFGWDAMEPERGRYDWSFWDEFVRLAVDEYGLRLIPYVCYTPKWAARDPGDNSWRSPPRDPADFARFLTALVNRYHGRIHSWELWNEPDNQAYWLGTAEDFARLAAAGAAAVRHADPSARVVLGGIAGEIDFLAKALQTDALASGVDVVNVHNYFETWHPNPIERLPRYLEEAATVVRQAGGHQPLWVAEMGYSSTSGRSDVSSVYRAHFRDEHTETAQANALARMVLSALADADVQLIAWYRINDLPAGQNVIGDDNNRHLGVRHADGSAKPAFAVFRFLAERFRQPFVTLVPEVIVERTTPGTQPDVVAFRLRDGRVLLAAWLGIPDTPASGPPGPDDRSTDVRIRLPHPPAGRVRLEDAQGKPVRVASAAPRVDSGVLTFTWRLQAGEVRIAEIAP